MLRAVYRTVGRSRATTTKLDPRDVVAGLSVAVVLVPQSLAYAQLAGFPPIRGLFAAAIPPLAAAWFASSPYLQPGPTAVSALLTYGALGHLARPGSERYIELGLLLALIVGLIRIAVGMLHAGALAYLPSQPLLVGFVPAAAILIITSQIPTAFGVDPPGQNQLYGAAWTLVHPSRWERDSILAALGVSLILALNRRAHPLFPGVLLSVTGATLISRFIGFDGATLGHIHSGLPPLTRSLPLGALPRLITPAFVIALIGFAEAASIARTYATIERTRWDANREFLSQGVANIAAGVFGGFPVGASFSRSALNRLAGAKSKMSGLVTGLAVLAFLPLGGVLTSLPKSVLAATVIVAVTPLIRIDRIVEIARFSQIQVAVTLTAFVLTLALAPHVEWAILAAMGLSIAIHLWRELRLDIGTFAQEQGLVLVPEGVLWFGTAQGLEDRFVELLADHSDATQLTVRLDRLGRIDLTGALTLRSLIRDAERAGLDVNVTGRPAHASRVLGRVLSDDHTRADP